MEQNVHQSTTQPSPQESDSVMSESQRKRENSKVDVLIALAVLTAGWTLTYLDFFFNEYNGLHDSTLYALAQAMLFSGFVLTGKAYIDYSLLKYFKR